MENEKSTGSEPNPNARPFTLGEYRVGITFNPGGHEDVNNIKKQCAALIDDLQAIAERSTNPEVKRLCALAQTHIEDGTMWGVKAATKPAR